MIFLIRPRVSYTPSFLSPSLSVCFLLPLLSSLFSSCRVLSLPYASSDINACAVGQQLCKDFMGRASGEAFVMVATEEQAQYLFPFFFVSRLWLLSSLADPCRPQGSDEVEQGAPRQAVYRLVSQLGTPLSIWSKICFFLFLFYFYFLCGLYSHSTHGEGE